MLSLSGKGILKGGIALLLVIAAAITYTIIFRGEEEVSTLQRISKRIKVEPPKIPPTQPLQETAAEKGVATSVSETPSDKKEPAKEAKISPPHGIVKPEGIVPPKELTSKSEKKDIISAEDKDIKPDKLAEKTLPEKQGELIEQKELKTRTKPKGKVAHKSKDWAINFSSTASKEEALELTERLKKKGYNAYVARFESKGGSIWYRVRVGFFASEKEAKNVAQKIAGEFSLKDYWLVKPSYTEIDRFSKG